MRRHFSKVRGPRTYWAPQAKTSVGPAPPPATGSDAYDSFSFFFSKCDLGTVFFLQRIDSCDQFSAQRFFFSARFFIFSYFFIFFFWVVSKLTS